MDKQQAIREALRERADGISTAELSAAVGFSLQGQMRALTSSGEVERTKDGYKLNPAYTPGVAPARKRRKSVKRSTKKTDRQKLRELVIKAKAYPAADVRTLAVENYRAAGQSLRNHLRENVENIEGDAVLCMLLDQHERAEKIVDAAGSQ